MSQPQQQQQQKQKQKKNNVHVVEVSDLALLVGNNGEVERVAANLLDVGGPTLVALDRVSTQTQQLDATLLELGLEAGHLAELGCADGSVVLGVGEEDEPVVANVLVQVNGALGRLGLEVGGDGAQTEAVVRSVVQSVLFVGQLLLLMLLCSGSTYGAALCSAIVTVMWIDDIDRQ